MTGKDSSIRVELLCAETRVAPVRNRPTLPRLELMGVLIATRLANRLSEALESITIGSRFIWTDSKVTLAWITSKKALPQFVANRVREICGNGTFKLRYVPSQDNSADLPTKGTSSKSLLQSNLWWHGPIWLSYAPDCWPNAEENLDGITKILQSLVDQSLNQTVCSIISTPSPILNLANFSTLPRLLRVVAYCLRFISNARKKGLSGPLSSEEIGEARKRLDFQVQKECFNDDISNIKHNRFTGLRKQLNLFLDDGGIIRCQGRIDNSALPTGAKYPKLLPKNHHYTRLIVEDVHRKMYHQGVRHTTVTLRLQYWLPQCRQQIQKILSQCTICRKWEGPAFETPRAPPLSEARVTGNDAFSCCGLDYAGSVHTKEGKAWICLFTSAVSRAIHLELVPDMTTHQFLLAFRFFVSRKGCPKQVYSDNAKTFKPAKGTLEYLWATVITHPDVLDYTFSSGVKWVFNVERAPWWGGFFERMVGLVKRALRKGVIKQQLKFIELETQLCEIEAILNSLPLTFVYSQINDGKPLCPNDLMGLRRPVGFPNAEYSDRETVYGKEESTESLSRRVMHTQKVLNSFWKIWRDEYLIQLREQHLRSDNQGKMEYRSPQVEELVIIKEELPRSFWKMGIVNDVYHGRDNYVRAAEMKLSDGKLLRRPIQLLYPLEIRSKDNSALQVLPNTNVTIDVNERPKRVAAVKAASKINAISSLPSPEDIADI